MAKLETAVNVAILVTCAAVVSTLGMRYVGSARAVPESPQTPTIAVGQRLPHLNGIRLEAAERTLVMFLRADCRYCSESIPFYQRLSRAVRDHPGKSVQLVMVTSDASQVAADYVRRNDLFVAGIVVPSADERKEIRIQGTPALVLVDRTGVVQHVWMGKLDPKGESEVSVKLFSS